MNINIDLLTEKLSKLSEDELNSFCDFMDTDFYEDGWNEIYDNLNVGKLIQHPNQVKNFVTISSITKQHEITGYISDALDLIFTAEKENYKSKFLDYLKDCFQDGNIQNLTIGST